MYYLNFPSNNNNNNNNNSTLGTGVIKLYYHDIALIQYWVDYSKFSCT